MVTKALFHALQLPTKDGNFFVRPDRILGAFVLPASVPPAGQSEALEALEFERAEDDATKELLGAVQRDMAACEVKLRGFNRATKTKSRNSQQNRQDSEVGQVRSGESCGDVEMPSPPHQFGDTAALPSAYPEETSLSNDRGAFKQEHTSRLGTEI
jgi:hypothetical protein